MPSALALRPFAGVPSPQVIAALLGRVKDAVVIVDHRRRVTAANERFLAWVERPAPEVEGRDAGAFWDDGVQWEEWWHGVRLQAGGSSPEVLDLRTRGGDPVPVEVQFVPLTGVWGRPRGGVLVLHDLRPRRVLERLLGEDPLTGTLSRPAILQRLEDEVVLAQKYGTGLGALILDVDGFRCLNERWGQEFGDQILRVVGAELREDLRPGDQAGRWGSEEFLVVLPLATFEETEDRAQRLRLGIEQRLFAVQTTEIRVTVSVGVSVLRPGGRDSLAALLARLESALVRAQDRGFNRIESTP